MMTQTLDQLTALPLRRSADPAFRKALASGDAATVQRAIVKASVKTRQKLDKALGGPRLASLWSAHSLAQSAADQQLLQQTHNADPATICRCVAESFASSQPQTVFQTLLAAELVMRAPEAFTAEQFVQIYVQLATCDLSALLSTEDDDCQDFSQTVQSTVAQAELPFVLSLLFAPFQCSKLLNARGIEWLADCVEEATDTDGTLNAEDAENMSQWLAPFIRVQAWSKAHKQPWGRSTTRSRWNQCLTNIAGCTIATGFLPEAETTHQQPIGPQEVFFRAVELAELPDDSPLPAFLKSLARGPAKKSKAPKSDATASNQSDWATAALLRNRFSADADAISVHWKTQTPTLNVATLGSQLLTGEWNTKVTVDGKAIETAGSWVCTCWFQDAEVVFAELEAGSADGVRHVRHVMLSLTDHFAVITNTASAPNADAQVSIHSQLQLASHFSAEANSITRELSLSDGRVGVRAIPCWLADDRIDSCAGDFSAANGQLTLQAEGLGGVAAPMVLDWQPERQYREADWNSLTVTEERRLNSSAEASAFRVRIGMLQLMLYRSLRRGEKLRAVLGYHTDNETVYGHIRNSGKIDPLVLVESEA